MTALPAASARPSRRVLVTLLLLAVVAALTGLPGPGASAAPPAPTKIVVTAFTSSVMPPVTAGTPAVLVAPAPETFDVAVALVDDAGTSYPVSNAQETVLRISVLRGATAFVSDVAAETEIPAGGSTAVFEDLALSRAANGVQLTVEVGAGTKRAFALTPAVTAAFDVVRSFTNVPVPQGDRGSSLLVSGDGIDQPCEPTAETTTCADLVLPNGVSSDVFFSNGVCDADVGCRDDVDLLQVLADFEYSRTAPATIVWKCDKTACGGGGVPSKVLKVNLLPTGPLADAPPCDTKGTVGAAQDYCVDYVQSKRDVAGDLHLYLLLVRDARMSF